MMYGREILILFLIFVAPKIRRDVSHRRLLIVGILFGLRNITMIRRRWNLVKMRINVHKKNI